MIEIKSVTKVDWYDIWLDPFNGTIFVTSLKHDVYESN